MAFGSDIPLLRAINVDAAFFVARAIIFSAVGILALVGFILARRAIRRRYFDRLASAEFYVRQHWNEILSGEISADDWRAVRDDSEAIIALTLDRMDAAEADESAKLLNFIRNTGMLDRIAVNARRLKGWRREAALVRLGRTRAPEAVPILVAALDDPRPATQLAAVRGLARTGLPTAAEAMLERVVTGELAIEATSLLNALMICTRRNPRLLLPFLYVARGKTRELLARVMSEIASLELGDDLLVLATDISPEVRASVARALGHADFGFAFAALDSLATNHEWFVRLRAITSLGHFHEPRALPVLMRGICDRNRHVRQRAAEALAQMPNPQEVLREVIETNDAYALQAFIAELDRAGQFQKLVDQLESPISLAAGADSRRLLLALENGAEKLGAMMRLQPAQKALKTN
jgi:HEAT repeat protein